MLPCFNPAEKGLEYKRHFMKVLIVAICDSLCLMVPLLNSIHFSCMASSAGTGGGHDECKKVNAYVVLPEKWPVLRYKSKQQWEQQPEILATKCLFLAYLSERVSVFLQMHLNWFSNTCLTQFKWRVERSERGAFKCKRWQHVRPRMYRLCGSSRSLSHHSSLPLFLLALVSSSHSLFCSLFFPLSLPLPVLCLFLWLLH